MKVTVTGGAGKLGQWVVRELVEPTEDGVPHEVTVFDLVAGPAREGGSLRGAGRFDGAARRRQVRSNDR